MSSATLSPPPTSLPQPHLWRQRAELYTRTVDRNPWIPERVRPASNPKQRQFLLFTDVLEVFYGGAAGGGKTYATLMAAAQFVDVPGYSALLLRENFADLSQPGAWIPLSKEWWYHKAHWSAAEHRWTFPSGATITFGYLERDDSVYQYDTASYQFIAIDELVQHTEWRYRFMFGRLRRPLVGPVGEVPLRMRSASNPGGKGHIWVKQRFIDPETREPGVLFVPARLEDNAGNMDVDSYRQGSLSKLDSVTRARRELGDWDVSDTTFFRGLENVKPLAAAPTPDQFTRRVRAWDLACLVAGTKVTTLRGDVPIETVRAGDYALTRNGWRRVKWAALTKHVHELTTVRFANGAELTGTPDHRVWTENRGWVDMRNLTRGGDDVVVTGGRTCRQLFAASPIPKSFSSTGCTTPAAPGRSITRRGGTTRPPRSSSPTPFTAPSGGITTAISPPVTTSTTSMATTTITSSRTWRYSPAANTPSFTTASRQSTPDRMPMPCVGGPLRSAGPKPFTSRTPASGAASSSHPAASTCPRSFAAKSVARNTTDSCGLPVYDLEVEGEHEFFANSILVHNSTEKQVGTDPDYTAGVLIGKHKDGTFWVLDVIRERLGPQGVRNLIRQTAAVDGVAVPIRVEREGGASGKIAADSIIREDLAGYAAAAVPARGSKAERAEPWAAQVEAGNVRIVRNQHTSALLDEHRSFPLGAHDDMVDACSLGFAEVALPAAGIWWSGERL